MNKRSHLPATLTAIALVVLFVGALHSSNPATTANTSTCVVNPIWARGFWWNVPKVKIDLDEKNQSVTVELKNNSDSDQQFIDNIRTVLFFGHDPPEGLGILIKDNNGLVMPKSGSYDSAGYMSHNSGLAGSTAVSLPVKRTILSPNQSIASSEKIPYLLRYTDYYWKEGLPEKIENPSISFRLSFYLDAYMLVHQDCVSPWFPLKDKDALKALVLPQSHIYVRQ